MRRLTGQCGWIAIALSCCALLSTGCAHFRLPQIDPSGERLFVDPDSNPRSTFRELPPTDTPSNRTGLVVCPRASVAPIGSEVVLLAGVRGPDEYLRTNERVEWMIDPGSVGQFIDLDRGSWTDPFVGDFTKAKKIDNTYAVNTTSRRLLTLTRGTEDKSDDVDVLKGQAWVTLTSAREGTSNVTVYCPGVRPWEVRTQSCQIHWVDAEWRFPSLAIAQSGGRQLMTTTVTRQSDSVPRCGWIVRYEIAAGPPAGFAPDGSQVVEVTTDREGKASVELFQKEPKAGSNKIAVQVIRPAGLGCPDKRIVIGRTCVLQTWSAPDLAVRVIGPGTGSVGSNLNFRIEVSNPGDMAAEGISLSALVPEGLAHVSATPRSEGAGRTLRWNVGRLGPGQKQSIAVDLRSERAGQFEFCAEAATVSGLTARDCASVSAETASLNVEIRGPTEATVGDSVTHRIIVSNRGRVPANALIITDRRDPGLEHKYPELQIEKSLGSLGPMQSQEVTITFRVQRAGRLCHTVEIAGAGNLWTSSEACIVARDAAVPEPSPSEPTTPSPGDPDWIDSEQPAPAPVTPPLPQFDMAAVVNAADGSEIDRAAVGDTVLFLVSVASTEARDLENLTLTVQVDPAFEPKQASDGHVSTGNGIVWESIAVGAGDVGRFGVECVCVAESDYACIQAEVRDAGGGRLNRQACIQIGPAPAAPDMTQPPDTPDTTQPPVNVEPQPAPGLELTIDSMHDPVEVGKEFNYRVAVTNRGYLPEQEVQVAVAFGEGLTPLSFLTRGPSVLDRIKNNIVFFKPVPQLPAGETLTYTIRVSADRTGVFQVTAQAISAANPDGELKEDTVTVNSGF